MLERTRRPLRAALRGMDRYAVALYLAMSVVAFGLLLYIGRHGSFFQDEWTFIRIGGIGTLRDWFAPHNEHWSTVPFALYRVLLLTVGLRSYLPYLAVLLILHLLVAAAVFVLVRRTAGAIFALLGSGLFLVLGSGYQDLFWAFQIGFVGSTAGGLWALVAIEAHRPRVAAVLLLAAVASSTMGLAFLAAGGTLLALDRERRRDLLWLVPVALAFLGWFVVIGHQGLNGGGSIFSVANLIGIPRFVALGIWSATRATFGLGGSVGGILAISLIAGAVAAAMLAARRHALSPLVVAGAVGLAALYALIGLGRVNLGDDQATRSRYEYEAAALLLVALAALLGRRADPLAMLLPDDRSAMRLGWPTPGILGLAVVALVAVGALANVRQLPSGARFFAEGAGELRATIDLVGQYGEALPYRPPPLTRWSIPSPAQLADVTREWGTPARDILVSSVVRSPTPLERDRALWRLVGGAVLPREIEAPSGAPPADALLRDDPVAVPPSPGAPAVQGVTGASLVRTGPCVTLDAGDAVTPMDVVLVAADGGSVAVATAGGGEGAIRLGRQAPPDRLSEASVTWPNGSWVGVTAPRLGDGSSFGLQLLFPAGTRFAAVCAR